MADYTSHSDAQLIDLLKDEDHDAFTELYRRYWAKLYLYALKLVKGDHDEATDIVQDVLSYVWHKRHDIIINTSVTGFLYTAIRYQMLASMRRHSSHEKFKTFFRGYISQSENTTDEYLLEKELQNKIERAVAALPAKMKEIFELSRFEQLSRKLIAEKLNISEKTVKVQIENALKALRKKIN